MRLGAQARALEGQCITVQAPTIGPAPWCEAIDVTTGAAGIYCPPDRGFPPTGVLAAGEINQPGWTYAEADLAQIAEVRRDGIVLNRAHWTGQEGRDGPAPMVSLR